MGQQRADAEPDRLAELGQRVARGWLPWQVAVLAALICVYVLPRGWTLTFLFLIVVMGTAQLTRNLRRIRRSTLDRELTRSLRLQVWAITLGDYVMAFAVAMTR